MRVRANVDLGRDAGRERFRLHMIEEDERPYHPPLRDGKDAPDFEPAKARRRWV